MRELCQCYCCASGSFVLVGDGGRVWWLSKPEVSKMESREFVSAGGNGPLRNRLVKIVANRTGLSLEKAHAAIAEVEAETGRPFLDWLLNGGLEKLITLILRLAPLFTSEDK